MKSLEINSYKHKYHVHFVSSSLDLIKEYIKLGYIFIIDENLKHFNVELFEILPKDKLIRIKANENSKSFKNAEVILNQLLALNANRDNPVIVLGGGTVQDAASFPLSIYKRGVKWIYFPTTFPAQCDSCIGSKTSINLNDKKNLLGTFFPPARVNIDINFLYSLPSIELRAGLGEILHYFCFSGEKRLAILENLNFNELNKTNTLRKLIIESLATKKELIEIDEFDEKERNVFNFGHTFAHALESISDYSIPHGIAVAYGIDIANYISEKRGWLTNKDRLRVQALIKRIVKGVKLDFFDIDKYMNAFKNDKKSTNKGVRFIYMNKIGSLNIHEEVLNNDFKKLIESYFTNEIVFK